MGLASFDSITTITPASTDWTYYEVPLNTTLLSGTGKHIAFKHVSKSSSYALYLDDVTVGVISNCIKPSNVAASDISTNNATISWTENGTATTWNIEYGPAGFTLGTGTIINSVTNPYTLTGLTTSTEYDIYVQAVCSSSEQSAWSIKYSFRTTCENVSTLPYTENFDAYGTGSSVFHPCWFRPTATLPYLSSDNHSAPAGVYFFSLTNASVMAVSPAFDASIDSLQVSFWLKAQSFMFGSFQIGVMSNASDISTFDTIITITPTSNDWTYYEVPLNTSRYSGANYHIAFNCLATAYFSYSLDDVTVDYIPHCSAPENLNVTDISNSSVTVAWTSIGTETAWVLEYKTTADTSWNAINVSSNPYTLSGLTASTSYNVRVKAICSINNESDYIATTFTTEGSPIVTFTITATAGNNGTISPSGEVIVVQGEDTTFNITPNNGYIISALLIDGNSVTITNSYTFTDVQANHTIHADFEENVTVDTCYTPTALTVDPNSITSSSASLSWTSGYNETAWEIEYKTDDDANWSSVNVTTNPYTLSGLTANTTYKVRIKAICDETHQSDWSTDTSFTTACSSITTLPYMENFNSYGTTSGTFPTCWYRPLIYNIWGVDYPSLSSVYYSSPACLKLQSDPTIPTYAISPSIEFNINTLYVSFWLKRENATSGTMQVGVMSSSADITTFENS